MPKKLHTWYTSVQYPLVVNQQSGVTRESLNALAKILASGTMGVIKTVELMKPYGKVCPDTWTRFIDFNQRAIQVTGLTYGYSGEGPHGLQMALKMVGAQVEIEEIGSWKDEHLILSLFDGLFIVEGCKCATRKAIRHLTN